MTNTTNNTIANVTMEVTKANPIQFVSKEKLATAGRFQSQEVSHKLKFGRTLANEAALYLYQLETGDVSTDIGRVLSNDKLNLLLNGDLGSRAVLENINEKDLRALRYRKIKIANADQLAKAFNTLEVSDTFYMNYLRNIKKGISVQTMFNSLTNIKKYFFYENEKNGEKSYDDAIIFNRFFEVSGLPSKKLKTVIVRQTILDDEGFTASPNGPVPNVFISSVPTQDGNSKDMVFVKVRYQKISESLLTNYISGLQQDGSIDRTVDYKTATFSTVAGETVLDPTSDNVFPFADNLLYVDAKMDTETKNTDDEKMIAKKAHLLNLKKTAMRNGMVLFEAGANGIDVLDSYGFTLRSGSQGRTQGFIAVKYADDSRVAVNILSSIGHDLKSYVKKESDTTSSFDVSKMISRPGLLASTARNLTKLNALLLDAKVNCLTKDMTEVVSFDGQFKMLCTEDFTVSIDKGLYKVLEGQRAYAAMMDKKETLTDDELARNFRILDAAEHPIELTVGDGQFFYGDLVHEMIKVQFGKSNGVNQFRISPATKGLGVYVPNLQTTTGYELILPKSAVKVPYSTVDLEKNPIEFAIANFGKEPGKLSNTFKMNYQFLGSLVGVDPSIYMDIVLNNFTKLTELLNDPSKLHDYKNYGDLVERLDSAILDGEYDEAEELSKTLISTFHKVFAANPDAHNDVWIQTQARKELEKAFSKFGRGEIYVDGVYPFMVQDPIAIVNAHLENITAYEEGRIDDITFDFNKDLAVIKEREVFLASNKTGKAVEQEIIAQRAPLIHVSESQKLKAADSKQYNRIRKDYPAFVTSVIVFSVLDFAAFAMGGADFDGDKCGVVMDSRIVEQFVPEITVLDMTITNEENGEITLVEGCPFVDTARTMTEVKNPKLKVDGWKLYFNTEDFEDVKVDIFNYLKEYALDTMVPTEIGLITDYATKLLDAIHVLDAKMKLTTDSNEIDLFQSRLELLMNHLSMLRVVQGWEIDKAKHGGAFKRYVDLSFLDDAPTDVALKDVNGIPVVDAEGNKVWADLSWMLIRKGYTTQEIEQRLKNQATRLKAKIVTDFEKTNTFSLISLLTLESKALYDAAFDANNFNVNITKNNLLPQIAPLNFTNHDMQEALRSELYTILSDYNKALYNIVVSNQAELDSLDTGKYYFRDRKHKAEVIGLINDDLRESIGKLNDLASKDVIRLYVNHKDVVPNCDLLIGKLAYEITYNRAIEKARKEPEAFAKNPARSTGFAWNVATPFVVALLSYLNNNDKVIAFTQKDFVAQEVEQEINFSLNKEFDVNFLNAVLRSPGASNIVHAHRHVNARGLESYMLISNGIYLGFVFNNEMTKLGFLNDVFMEVKEITQVKEGYSSATLVIKNKGEALLTEEQLHLCESIVSVYNA